MKKLLFILFCFINIIVYGTTYYVSNTGDDDSTGTSAAKAWKTLAKVNTITLQPGDTVFLNRGDTWIEQLLPKGDGTAGNYINITAYGTGAKPIITQKDTLPGWSDDSNWTDTTINSTTVWYMDMTAIFTSSDFPCSRLWIDGTEEKRIRELANIDSNNPWYYTWTTHRLYVVSDTNPGSAFTSIESAVSDRTITMSGDNYFKFSYLDIRGGWFAIDNRNSVGFVVDSCDIGYDTNGYGISAWGSSVTMEDIVISNCKFDSNCDIAYPRTTWSQAEMHPNWDAIYLNYAHKDWEIYNCYFYGWSYAGILCDQVAHPTYRMDSIFIHNNYFTAPNNSSGKAIGGSFALTYHSDIEVYNNVMMDMASGDQMYGTFKYYCNLINGTRGEPWFSQASMAGLFTSNTTVLGSESQEIYNNTIINCEGAGIFVGSTTATNIEWQDNKIYNNILYNNSITEATWGHATKIGDEQLWIVDGVKVLNGEYKNNLLYKSGATDLVYYGHDGADDYLHTVAEFNAENGTADDVIANNITGNPLFYDENNDTLSLNSSSPAIGAGIAIEWLTTDIVDSTFLDPPAIGAYEYYAYTPPSLPIVETSSAVFTYPLGATVTSNVVDDGGGTVSARGVCYSTETAPDTDDDKVTGGTGTGEFTSSITGLNAGNRYYIRAYATNEAGTTYGNELIVRVPAVVYLKSDGKYIKDSGKYVVDAPGQNLLLYSEQLDNEVWLKSNTTVTAGAVPDLNGSATMDTVKQTGDYGNLRQDVDVIPGVQYVFSFDVQRGAALEKNTMYYRVIDNISGLNIIANTNYYSQTNAESPVRVSIPFTAPAGCTSVKLYIVVLSTGSSGSFYAGRAQLAYPGMNYIVTTSTNVE